MESSLEVKDKLESAHSKMMYLEWALSAGASSGELMGSPQQDGLAFILGEIREAIGGALEYNFRPRETKVNTHNGITEESPLNVVELRKAKFVDEG